MIHQENHLSHGAFVFLIFEKTIRGTFGQGDIIPQVSHKSLTNVAVLTLSRNLSLLESQTVKTMSSVGSRTTIRKR